MRAQNVYLVTAATDRRVSGAVLEFNSYTGYYNSIRTVVVRVCSSAKIARIWDIRLYMSATWAAAFIPIVDPQIVLPPIPSSHARKVRWVGMSGRSTQRKQVHVVRRSSHCYSISLTIQDQSPI